MTECAEQCIVGISGFDVSSSERFSDRFLSLFKI